MSFAYFLKDEMRYQGMTTRALAEASGVNKRTIDHYLMSKAQEPSVSNAYKLAKALRVSVEYLLTGSKNQKTDDDNEFLKAYNLLSANQKELVMAVIRTFAKQNAQG